MDDDINITSLDNQTSIKYKLAQFHKIPARLLVQDVNQENTYLNGITLISNEIAKGKSLNDIYDDLGDDLYLEDIVMIYIINTIEKVGQNDTLRIVNLFFDSIEEENYRDVEDLNFAFDEWKNGINEEYQEDIETLRYLIDLQNELSKLTDTLSTSVEITRVTLKISPTFKNNENNNNIPNVDDGITIFNNAIPSYNVPYVRYNTSGDKRREYFKLYRGETDEKIPKYNIIIPSKSQTNKDDTIYSVVWSGKGSVKLATKESYIKSSYNLSANEMTIEAPVKKTTGDDSIIGKLESSLGLNMNDQTVTGINGFFYMYDVEIDDIYFTDMIINSELMSSYIFIKETNKPFAEKSRIKIYFRSEIDMDTEEKVEGYILNPSSVSASITQNYAQGGEIVTVESGTGLQKFKLPTDMPYIKVKITQTESIETAKRFKMIFSKLLQYYKIEKDKIKNLFVQFIPELGDTSERLSVKEEQTRKKRFRKKTGASKIERLKDAAPDVFVSGYARICQCGSQPVAIPNDETDSWKNHGVARNGELYQRQIMSYPPNNAKWNFVCPEDDVPYPGVRENNILSNKDVYPYVPCCFKQNQMNPSAKTGYNEYYRGKFNKKVGGVRKIKTHKTKTDRILDPGRPGYLPLEITDLVSKYSNDSKDIMRIGVPKTVNSLLHCVSVAISDQKYMGLPTDADKENYVTNLRMAIKQQIDPSLLKQEMYDFTDDEIMNAVENGNMFFDPNLFYRAIEETYKINIYVFSPPKESKESGENKQKDILELPRFKLFHSESPRPDRPCILIFRTEGADADSLEYPQCEIIADYDANKNLVKYIFGKSMNELIFNSFLNVYRTMTWKLDQDSAPGQIKTLTARENMYSRVNYYEILKGLPKYQVIDSYGKARAFILQHGNELVTVVTPPSQPENVKSSSEITRCSYQTAVNVFKTPNAVSKNVRGDIDGLWYQVLDIKHGIYIPIKPMRPFADLENLEVGPENPLDDINGISVTERVIELKKTLNLFMQIIIWLYLLSNKSYDQFMNDHSVIESQKLNIDTTLIYDFSTLKMTFPEANTLQEGISRIRDIIPTMFREYNNETKVYFYNEKFFKGILYFLEKYEKELRPEDVKVPKVIYRNKVTEDDFDMMKRVAIFTNEKDMETWISNLGKLSFENIVMKNKLNSSDSILSEPYMYSAPDGKIYLIQNVVNGELSRAINVSYNWFYNKFNPGHESPIYQNDNYPIHVIYNISPSMTPMVYINNAGDALQYLQILMYNEGQYASMLPLL